MNALQTSITATDMPFAMIKLPFSLAPVNQDTREMEESALVNITFVLLLWFIGSDYFWTDQKKTNWLSLNSISLNLCISLSSKALQRSFFRN